MKNFVLLVTREKQKKKKKKFKLALDTPIRNTQVSKQKIMCCPEKNLMELPYITARIILYNHFTI